VKIIIQFLLIGLLSTLTTGCLTRAASREAFKSKLDWFEPTAIYKSQGSDDLVIEGGCFDRSTGQKTLIYAPAYLIVPAKVLAEAHKKSGGNVTFSQIINLPDDIRNNLKLQKNLPVGFGKIADVPPRQPGIQVNKQTQVNVDFVAKLPFTLVIDAAALPIEAALICTPNGLKDVH
jgi:hypothetical protein